MGHGVAFYEVIEIVCAALGLGLEGYAFFRDSQWNKWLYQFDESMNKMCANFNDMTMDVAPILNSTGYFGGAESGRIHISMFYRNSSGEIWYVFSEVLAIVGVTVHLVYALKSKRIGKVARYGAYIHLLVFSCMVPASLLLATSAYHIENSYKIMAAYHPQCINFIFCKEQDSLQDEIDDIKAEEIQEDLRDLNFCQHFWIKLTSAVFGAIHAFIAFLLVFVSMSVASRYEEEAYADAKEAEEPANFYKHLRCPSEHLLCQSRISLNTESRAAILKFEKSNTSFAERYFLSKEQDEDSHKDDESIDDILMTRRLSPQSLYREYKFRKMRIAEMERDQNFAQDPRVTQPGWDYKDVDNVFIKNVTDMGAESESKYPKRIIRKPQVINYAEEVSKKMDVKIPVLQPGQQIVVAKEPAKEPKPKKKKSLVPLEKLPSGPYNLGPGGPTPSESRKKSTQK